MIELFSSVNRQEPRADSALYFPVTRNPAPASKENKPFKGLSCRRAKELFNPRAFSARNRPGRGSAATQNLCIVGGDYGIIDSQPRLGLLLQALTLLVSIHLPLPYALTKGFQYSREPQDKYSYALSIPVLRVRGWTKGKTLKIIRSS